MSSTEPPVRIEHRLIRPLALSCAIMACVVGLIVNQCLLFWQPLTDVDPESLPSAHTWVWWATREFMEKGQAPDIVLLGSSLLMHPISRLDADYMNIDLDYVHHHRSVYIEAALRRHFGVRQAYCFNFALPGGMVSDDYIVTRALLKNQRKPRAIVLALCPRDFMDNGVHWSGGTQPFRYLRRFANIDDLVDIAMPQVWQRFEYLLGKGFYLFDKRLDLQVMCAEKLKRESEQLLGRMLEQRRSKDPAVSIEIPPDTRSEVEEGMFIVKAHQEKSFQDNTAEYRKRYRTANENIFSVQEKFLQMLLAHCKDNGIAVVIVNMPVTAENMKLLPAGTYERYLRVLSAESAKTGASLLDLNQDPRFQPDDFYDTIHMNGDGGRKLADAILSIFVADPALCASISPVNSHRYFATQTEGQQL